MGLIPHAQQGDHFQPGQVLLGEAEICAQSDERCKEDEGALHDRDFLVLVKQLGICLLGVVGERKPGECVEPLQHGLDECRGLQPGGAQLEEEHVGVHH